MSRHKIIHGLSQKIKRKIQFSRWAFFGAAVEAVIVTRLPVGRPGPEPGAAFGLPQAVPCRAERFCPAKGSVLKKRSGCAIL